MVSIEERFKTAIAEKDIPAIIVAASDSKGRLKYVNAFGPRSLKEGAQAEPLAPDATLWLASCTKLMTAIAAVQCVERGLFTLDEDVTRLLPELNEIEILKGFKDGTEKPILVKATKKITLRHLLTHSSGIAYDIFDPMLTRWRASRGEKASLGAGSLIHRCTVPLLFEPGESYAYSTGLDWAGMMIERANGMSLGKYMQKYIWDLLGIKNMTFHLEERPDMLRRRASTSERMGGIDPKFGTPADPSSKIQNCADGCSIWWPDEGVLDDSGGAGAFGSIVDYQKILHSITAGDGKLLSKKMNDELFRPQLGDGSQKRLMALCTFKEINDIDGATLPIGTQLNYALGGALCMEDMEGRRRKGTMYWAGLPNLYWFADRETGISGIYGSQVLPPGDPKSSEMFKQFEMAMYKEVKEDGHKL
ncbi:beta-lactamase/transpeptidase-like protein [Rhexocercosporidium sp. MPI-PUGE-AT-0058]|nr:beta-lactamase/transpeptidase-like protein [Rhexocercosporidium sp. MPI-PUGE-AT-0058]